MTNEEILKAAIEKAVNNGWKDETEAHLDHYWPKWDDDMKLHIAEKMLSSETNRWFILLFSHGFAKAFWKEEPRMMYLAKSERAIQGSATFDGAEAWKAHLQQMILEPAPLKYIERFI